MAGEKAIKSRPPVFRCPCVARAPQSAAIFIRIRIFYAGPTSYPRPRRASRSVRRIERGARRKTIPVAFGAPPDANAEICCPRFEARPSEGQARPFFGRERPPIAPRLPETSRCHHLGRNGLERVHGLFRGLFKNHARDQGYRNGQCRWGRCPGACRAAWLAADAL